MKNDMQKTGTANLRAYSIKRDRLRGIKDAKGRKMQKT